MTQHSVVDGRLYHCGMLVRHLRLEHRQAAALVGADLHRELRVAFEESFKKRAWLIDGKLAALMGVVGSGLSPYGFVWMGMTEAATRYPVTGVRIIRRELDQIMEEKWGLATTVIGGDATALRFAAFLGFHTQDPGMGSRAYDKSGRRRLIRHIENDADGRVPYGNGFLVKLGYAPMEAR